MQPVQDLQRERQLLEDLERLRLAGLPTGRLPPPRAFTPLLDVPVDMYISDSVRHRSLSPARPNWTQSDFPHSSERHGRSPQRDSAFPQTSHHDSLSSGGDSVPQRGRSPHRNGHRTKTQNGKEVKYTVMSAHRRSRTPLTQVFGPGSEQDWRGTVNGHSNSKESHSEQEYELTTVSISKTKQSLGELLQDTCFENA